MMNRYTWKQKKGFRISVSSHIILCGLCLAPILAQATSETTNNNLTPKINFDISVETGLGYDSNIYRAPKDSYVDRAKLVTPPTINPVVQSGVFIPVLFDVNYSNRFGQNNVFSSRYKFKGQLYTNNKYNNANQLSHRIDIGNTSTLSSGKKQSNHIYAGGFIGSKKRLYIDRDTGENQLTSTSSTDISERYSYNFYGLELIQHYKKSGFELDGKIDYQSRTYTKTVVSEYDNTQIGVGGKITWRVAKPTKINLGLKTYTLNFSNRPSRDEAGALLSKNPKRKYVYTILSTGIRHRLNKQWLAYFDVDNKIRVDKYKNYDDYTKLRFKARLHYRMSQKHKIKLTASLWNRDYNNAYAFDNATYGVKKTYDGSSIKLVSHYDIDEKMQLKIAYQLKNQNSSDLRYVYTRSLLSANVEWKF